jgi:SSS family transporter
MSPVDWIVLGITLFFIIIYGMWKSRDTKNIEGYLLAERKLPWYHVGLSVMATQASAITFLSAPGQGYTDGLRFVQFYFGLPLAMIVLCVAFVPRFHTLNVYTAYEYLEKRFDNRTRTFTALLFLLQRGLSTGVTIYAPAIILSTILHVSIVYTILFNGVLVIIYTVYGGTRAVSYTQVLQMTVIFSSLFLAGWLVVHLLPPEVSFTDALHIAGKMDKLNALDTTFDLDNRYNIWSGLIGGFFLQLSYFGTDQSQVGRYLTGSSVSQSRLGLIMNGFVKIPMQFFILLIGTMVFTFYQFHQAPLFFNETELTKIEHNPHYQVLVTENKILFTEKQKTVNELLSSLHNNDERQIEALRIKLHEAEKKQQVLKKKVVELLEQNDAKSDLNDSNYIFLHFVTKQMPVGIVGLLMAVIFLAAMGSTASGMNSLASATVVDLYKRVYKKNDESIDYLRASRIATVYWGIFCIGVAFFASRLGNLIEAVNILGSLFYGTILGIFMVAFFFKKIGGEAVFFAALTAEVFVVAAWLFKLSAFLWLNVIGCVLVVIFALLLQRIRKE